MTTTVTATAITATVTATAITASAITAAAASSTISAATATTTESTTTSTSSAVTCGWAGVVDLDFLTIYVCTVQLLHGLICHALVSHGYKGVTLLCDVDIGDITTSSEFTFQGFPWAV